MPHGSSGASGWKLRVRWGLRGEKVGSVVVASGVFSLSQPQRPHIYPCPCRDQCAVIVVDTPYDVCLSRVQAESRRHHPTLPATMGTEARTKVVDSFFKSFDPPAPSCPATATVIGPNTPISIKSDLVCTIGRVQRIKISIHAVWKSNFTTTSSSQLHTK